MKDLEVGLTIMADGVASGSVTVQLKSDMPGTEFEPDIDSLFNSLFYWAKDHVGNGVHVSIWKEE